MSDLPVRHLAAGLLGAHVRGRSHDGAGRWIGGLLWERLRRRARRHRFRETEIQHLHSAVRSDLDVRGLQIPVDDALSCAASSASAICSASVRASSTASGRLQTIGEGLAFDELEHQNTRVVCPSSPWIAAMLG